MNPDGTPLPDFLKGKRVMSLDVGMLIAGAKERGELESRVTKMLAEIRAAGNIILMCAPGAGRLASHTDLHSCRVIGGSLGTGAPDAPLSLW
jgi:hypothetical protein